MSAGVLEIVDPGLSTTVQDLGRIGWLRLGVPQCGALDGEAHRLANALVGGGPAQAALEIRYLGPTIRCLEAPFRVALVGAEASMRLSRGEEARAIGAWRSLRLEPGDMLKVGALKGAATATLAVEGGFDLPRVLGARATFVRGGFGGLDGRALAPGDRIALAAPSAPGGDRWIAPARRLSAPQPKDGVWTVRVVLGPQDDHFTAETIERFLAAVWTVSRQADRMGLRLEGPVLEHDAARGKSFNIVSEGVAEGAIQAPGTGQPIVLLADRGTAGGYPKIAVAASVDLALLGRLGPGERLRFKAASPAEARAALRAREIELQASLAATEPFHEPGAVDEAKLWSGNLITARIDDDA